MSTFDKISPPKFVSCYIPGLGLTYDIKAKTYLNHILPDPRQYEFHDVGAICTIPFPDDIEPKLNINDDLLYPPFLEIEKKVMIFKLIYRYSIGMIWEYVKTGKGEVLVQLPKKYQNELKNIQTNHYD